MCYFARVFCILYLILVAARLLEAQRTIVDEAENREQSSIGASWPEFRGPGRSGVSEETGLLREWSEGGPKTVWRRSLGEGFSGVSVSGGYVYTLFATAEDEFLVCIQAADGEEVWHVRIGDKFHDEFGNGPRATPTIDQGTVYALSSGGRLLAAEAASGQVAWQLELTERYPITIPQWDISGAPTTGSPSPLWGHSSSPLVYQDLLIVYTGAGNGKSLVAFDKRTGKPRWTALDNAITYSSPMVAKIGGRSQIILLAAREIISVLPTGEVLWSIPWAPTMSQPLFIPPDEIFFSTSLDIGALLTRISIADRAVNTEIVWKSRIMKNLHSSSVYYRGNIYGFDNATLKCIFADTGELRWAKRGLGKGTLVAADGLLMVLSDRGLLALVEANPDGFEEKGRIQVLEGRTWTAPTIAGGKLYLRNHEELVCLDLKE